MPRVATKLTPTGAGGFSARRRIPEDVREEYARFYGMRWEERFNSGPTTPLIAKAKWREWSGEIDARIANIRAQRTGSGQTLTPMQARGLSGEWYLWFVAKHEAGNYSAASWEVYRSDIGDEVRDTLLEPEDHEDNYGEVWEHNLEMRELLRPKLADWGETAQFLAAKKLTLDNASRELFLDNLYRDFAAALRLLIRRANGDYSEDKHARQFPDFTKTADPSLTPWSLFERWVAESSPATSTVDRWRGVFLKLRDDFPGRGAAALTNEEVADWIGGLVTAERSAATVKNVWLNSARNVFSWALSKKLLTRNPFREVRVTVRRTNRTRETKAFHADEATSILRGSLAVTDTSRKSEAAKRWMPWLCAYTGARGGEMAQLRGADVFNRDGIQAIRITPEAGTVKTRQARVVPIHEHLVAQGFLEFIERSGKGPLFYNARADEKGLPDDPTNPRKPRAVKARERVASWVRSIGVTDHELKPNHAWRHTFKQIADRVGISERVSDAITGHAPTSVARSYGAPTLEDMAEALKKLPRYEV